MTGTDAGRPLLERIHAREQAVTDRAELVRAQIEELTARLSELDEHLEHLRITRKTVLALADEPDTGQTRAHRSPSCRSTPPTSRS